MLAFSAKTLRLRKSLCGHLGHPVHCVAASRDGAYIVTGADDFLVKVWSAATSALHCTLRGHSNVINDITIDPTGRIVATVSVDKDVRLWRLDTGAPVAVFRHRAAATEESPAIAGVHTEMVNAVRFSSCGAFLATGADDGSCRLFDLRAIGEAAGAAVGEEVEGETEALPLALAQDAPGNTLQARVPHVALWSARDGAAVEVRR